MSLKEKANHISILKDAIEEGLNSGVAINFNPNTHPESLKLKRLNC